MRFYEFCVSERAIFDREQEMLNDWIMSSDGKSLRESTKFDSEATEFRNFANLHQQDLTQLVIGTEYYPISILAHPSAKSLTIEMSDQPVTLDQIENNKFIFRGPTVTYEIPINVETINDMGHHFVSTTVYTIVANREQFLTLIYSKFGGRWNIIKKKANV